MMKYPAMSAVARAIQAAEGLVARANELKLVGVSEKQYAVLRVQKLHTRAHVEVALKHNLREDYATNVDPEGNGIEVIAGARTVERGLARFDDILARVNDGEPLIFVNNGKQAVVALELVLDGPSQEVWDTWGFEKQTAWKQAQPAFLRRYFPSQSMVSCPVHMDEGRVHATPLLVPMGWHATRAARDAARKAGREIDDGDKRWHASAKSFVGTSREHFRARQTEYAEAMAPFGLIRGRFVEETRAIHIPNKLYRAKAAELCAGLEATVGDLLELLSTQVEITKEAEKAKREAEAMREQMTVAMRSEAEAIELMHVQARELIKRETDEAKASIKKDRAVIAAEMAKLTIQREEAQTVVATADKVAALKAETERHARDLADLNQRLTAERGRLGRLEEALQTGQRDLTAAQAELTSERRAAAEITAKAADVDRRESHVVEKEKDLKARIAKYNAGVPERNEKWRLLTEGLTQLADLQAKAAADLARADEMQARAERAIQQAISREREASELEKAYRAALDNIPYAHRAAVQRDSGFALERRAY